MITKRIMKVLRGTGFLHIMVLIFILGFLVGAPPWAHADIPRYINYQGKLTDADDNPVIGDVSITVKIYNAETGGIALWTETQTAAVTNGIFSILLGNTEELTEENNVTFDVPYWYSIEIESDGEMTPRQRLTAVSYSFNADRLDGLDSSKFLRADTDTSLTGNLTVTGGVITAGANEDVEINPTGTGNVIITIDSTSGDFKITDGTTNFVLVDNDTGNVTLSGTLSMSTKRIINLATPTATTDAATKAYVDSATAASGGGWTDGGTGVYLITSADNVGIGTTSTDTYKLNVSGSLNTTSLYIGGTQVTSTAAELNDVVVLSPSTAQTIQPTADVVPLTIKGKASATSNVLSIYDAAASPTEKIYVDSNGQMYIAETTTGAAQDSAATLYFGRNATDDWETIGYDPTLGTKGKYTFSAPLQIAASSPTGITFVDFDSEGNVSKTQDFTYDPDSDEFSFSGGVFAQQFKNLVKNSSFEAFSAFETFHGLDPNYATGTFDSTMGGMRDSTYGYEGGWENFQPDEWDWVGGDVFQNAPLFFKPAYSVIAATYTQDYAHGVSAVRLKDVNTGATGTGNDGEIKQTISGLEPLKVYSVGIAMRVAPITATSTTGLVDIVNELDVTGMTLNGNITSSTSKINITGDITGLPSSGILWLDPDTAAKAEEVSYTGKTANSVTGITRGINGTTVKSHASGITISCAFKQLEATKDNASTFTAFRGQFMTDDSAAPVEIHLIAQSTSADNGTVLFDIAQVVAGKSVPEYQPATIVDSGDQTIYGALRIGRASDEKGGILSVDKFVRTRGIEFFTDDPGLTGQKGGFVEFGGVNPPTGPYNTGGSVGSLSLFTGGTYTGSTQCMDFYVEITSTTPNQFKWYKNDGTGSGYVQGGVDVPVEDYTTDGTDLGSTGVNVRFSSTTGGIIGDRWDFFATRVDSQGGYDSYGAATDYTPSTTRIFKDPDPWSPTYNKLVFEDGGQRVSITDIVTSVGVQSSVDAPWPEWNAGTPNSGGLNVYTSGNYTNTTTDKFYKIRITSTGTAGGSSGTFKWDDGVLGWSGNVTMTSTEQAIGSEGVRVSFSENSMSGDPADRLSDAYITGGVVGDTWGFGVNASISGATIQTLNTIDLTPEFPTVVLKKTGTGSDIGNGVMTTSFDDTTAAFHNYYNWTGNASNQTYDIYVRVLIPEDFSSWANSAITYYTNVDAGATDAGVSLTVYDTADAEPADYTGGKITTADWAENTVADGDLDGTYTDGDYMTLQFTMTAGSGSNENAKLGEVKLKYNIE